MVVIILAVFGVYNWQQGVVEEVKGEKESLESKVASQSAGLTALKKESVELKSKVNFLEGKLKEATASANFEVGELTLSIKKTSRSNYTGDVTPDTNTVSVEISAVNDTEQTLFISKSSFKLKDDANRSYLVGITPPGYSELQDQQVQPGETIVAYVAFDDVPKNKTSLTLFYNSKTFRITAK